MEYLFEIVKFVLANPFRWIGAIVLLAILTYWTPIRIVRKIEVRAIRNEEKEKS